METYRYYFSKLRLLTNLNDENNCTRQEIKSISKKIKKQT